MSMLRAVSSKTLASVYASFFFIGCVALFIGFLRYLCRAVARCNPRGASPKAVAAMLRGVVQEMWGAGTAVDPEVEEQVWQTMSTRQVQLARVVMPAACFIGSRRAFLAASHLWSGGPSGRSMVQDAAFVVLFLSAALCSLMPQLLRANRLAFWHSFFTLMVHIITSPAANIAPIPEIALFQTKSFGGTIAVSLLCMRFPVLLVTQTLHSVGAVLALVMTVPHDVGVPVDEMIAVEVSFCFLKLAMFRFVTRLVDQSVRGEVASRVGACQRSAVSSLLGMMCDAVVDLDQDLAMKEHVGKMAGMLMHGSGTTLKGRLIADFLGSADDRHRFEDAVARCAAEGDGGALAPSMINVSLRDAIGNLISSVLYHVPYRSVAGRIHHLVGLREDVDARCEVLGASALEALPARGRAEMPTAVLTEAVLRGVRRQRRRSHGPRTMSSGSSGGSSGGSSPSDSEADQMVVEVFAGDVLPMNRASDRFVNTFGITGDPVGRSFRALLPEGTGDCFVEWLCEHARKVGSGESEAFIGVFGDVEIVTAAPGGKPWRLEACFPRPHRELQQRNMYLVGIRLSANDRTEASPAHLKAATGSLHSLRGGREPVALSMSL